MVADRRTRVIGLDVSGDFGSGLQGGVVDSGGGLVARKEWVTPTTSQAELVDSLVTMAQRLMQEAGRDGAPPTALGLAAPGLVDEASGVVRRSSNLPLHDVPLASILTERLGLPAFLIHECRAGILAESSLGSGRGIADILLVVIGRGVGSALISGGHLLLGANGAVGEIGHLSVDPAGIRCGCGGRGCVETLVSERALAQRYTLVAKQAVLPAEVVLRAKAGEPAASRVWSEAMDALATAVAAAAILIDCALVILAGPGSIPAAAVPPLRSLLANRMNLVQTPRVALSALGDSAGVLGAAAAAFERSGMTDVVRSWAAATVSGQILPAGNSAPGLGDLR